MNVIIKYDQYVKKLSKLYIFDDSYLNNIMHLIVMENLKTLYISYLDIIF